MEQELWERVAHYTGCRLDERQLESLAKFRAWLRDEAIPAGAVGPDEGRRLDERHVADAMLFRAGLEPDIDEIWDLGSGAGLPGIPLAITMPSAEVVLVERSSRRVRLIRRALRILDLRNATVIGGDVHHLQGTTRGIVARASLPPEEMAPVVRKHLAAPGSAVLGGSWTGKPRVEGWETYEIPEEILDRPIWLLIMRRR